MSLHIYNEDDLQGDVCSKEGAKKLAAKIEAYWRERGQDVHIRFHDAGFVPSMRSARSDVRSDMVNGLPRPLVFQNKGAA